jgi:hypothetical protein
MSIHCLEHDDEGKLFSTGGLKVAKTSITASITAKPRYFSFGKDSVIDIKIQRSILQSVTGEDPYLDHDTAINRAASLWKGWYLRKATDSRQFVLNFLSDVAH